MSRLIYSNKVLKFQDLFETWEPRDDLLVSAGEVYECEIDPHDLQQGYTRGMTISASCRADLRDGYVWLKVQPQPEVLRCVLASVIPIASDTITWNIVQGSRKKTALVLVEHNIILGSRWLADITLNSIPRPAAWEQPI